jgi:hypothetical protein
LTVLPAIPQADAPLAVTSLAIGSYQLLAGIASALLVFVSAGVVYLSAVEWRDRRRRRAAETSAAKGSRPAGKTPSAGKAASGSTPPRSPAAFGRRP